MATNEQDIWKELRKPFDPKVIGQLPRAGMKLDYVGHAAVTDRLLTVDPEWTWEPVAYDERGLPQYDSAGGLWIRLTVGGVTRLGYGDGTDPKVRIGDALRNAAMRFGVALDLWTKDELESHLDAPELKNQKPSVAQAAKKTPAPHTATPGPLIHPAVMNELREKLRAADMLGDVATHFVQATIGHPVPKTNEEVQAVIDAIKALGFDEDTSA